MVTRRVFNRFRLSFDYGMFYVETIQSQCAAAVAFMVMLSKIFASPPHSCRVVIMFLHAGYDPPVLCILQQYRNYGCISVGPIRTL